MHYNSKGELVSDAFGDLVGKTIDQIEGCKPGSGEVRFVVGDRVMRLFHKQDCCEHVEVEDVTGDPADLLGAVVSVAEERTQDGPTDDWGETSTYTFYEVRTTKGDITIRWLGSSNGYYSESVDVEWSELE